MFISIDKNGYINSWSWGDDHSDIRFEISNDLIPADWNLNAFNYYWNGKKLIFDADRKNKIAQEEKLLGLRQKREQECFSIINRGQFWYDTLTRNQKQELKYWYEAWLDVTNTMEIPTKPEWLK